MSLGSGNSTATERTDCEKARQVALRTALTDRLLQSTISQNVGLFIAIGLIGALCWSTVPHTGLIVWLSVVALCTAARVTLPVVLRRRAATPAVAHTAMRIALAAVALSWGAGPMVHSAHMPPDHLALIAMVFSGMIAGATMTLVADGWSYYLFTVGLLGPLAAGFLMEGITRPNIVAVLLILAFIAAAISIYRRAQRLTLDLVIASLDLAEGARRAEANRRILDGLLAASPTAIATVTADGRVRSVNPAFEQLFGYDSTEAVDRHLNDLIVPEKQRAEAEQLDLAVQAGTQINVEVERVRKDGGIVYVRASAAVGSAEGDGLAFIMYHDVSDLKASEAVLREKEAQYRQLVEFSSDLVWQIDRQGRWTYLNLASLEFFGVPPEQMIGQSAIATVAEEHRQADEASIRSVLRGADLTDYETVHISADGTRRTLSISARPQREATGRIVGAHGTARDISARVAARKAIEEARAEAERIATAKSVFLANMSHEIRTPMNGILGMTELLLDTQLTAEQRRSAALVRNSADALLDVINDILDFSKLDASRLTIEEVNFDLHGLLDSATRLLSVRAFERGIELFLDLQTEVPQWVRGDAGRLRQVLNNLIGNAIKFTERGEVTVVVTVESAADEAAAIRFGIRDTGIGIAEDKLGLIFDEFTQAESSTTRKYGGTGLGLAISRRLVDMMGGELQVVSQQGVGSEFFFTLRLGIGSDPEGRGPREVIRLDGVHALVVDDNSTNRRIVKAALEGSGMHVEEVASAQAALSALRAAKAAGRACALAVIDGCMPDRDGFDLALDVRADADIRDTRLMMLTSGGTPGDGQRCRDLGIEGYLTKPILRAELVEAVAAVLRGGLPRDQLVTRHSIEEARHRLRVLLAEDNPVNQQVALTMLRKRGHDVHVVENGALALDAVLGGSYDVVLMDVAMPVMDGIAATQAIRRIPRFANLPIIAVTAHAMPEERQRCIDAGMTDHLPKPFKPFQLFAAVEDWGTRMVGDGAAAAPTQSDAVPAAAPRAAVDIPGFRSSMREAGVEDAVDAMLDLFLEDAPGRVETIRNACRDGGGASIGAAAHALKSAAGTIFAHGLFDLLENMEVAGKAGDVEAARGMLAVVVAEYEAVRTFLESMRVDAPPAG